MDERREIGIGAQTPIGNQWLGPSLLVGVLAALIVLTMVAIIQANLCDGSQRVFCVELLDTGNAVTLLVGWVAFLAIRWQVAQGTRPQLTYKGQASTESDLGLEVPADERIWKVTLKNVGPGLAIFRDVKYRCGLDGSEAPSFGGRDQAVACVKNCGLAPDSDFVLREIGSGAALGSSDQIILFEARITDRLHKIEILEVKLEYQGTLGEGWRRTVGCRPKGGFPNFANEEEGPSGSR